MGAWGAERPPPNEGPVSRTRLYRILQQDLLRQSAFGLVWVWV
jgi:hypothetical protein